MDTAASKSGVSAAAKTSVIIPAFNEEQAIGRVVHALRSAAQWQEILVVDDASRDKTADAAAAAGAIVLRHPYNKGNGAAVKTGLRRAAGEFILIVDADGQHRPSDATTLLSFLDRFELVVGARSAATQASWSRRLGNGLLNALAGYLAGRQIPDLTSGFRAAHRERVLEFIHLIPNRFSTPTTTTLAFIKAGYAVKFVPIDAEQRTGVSKIRLGPDGAKFMLILLRVTTIFSPLRVFAPIVALTFSVGALYALWTLVTQSHITNSSVLLLLLSVLMLLVGLVSEQIASLRSERPHGWKATERDQV
jgi:glycosyltransferase involved in cell wall biosynthesis